MSDLKAWAKAGERVRSETMLQTMQIIASRYSQEGINRIQKDLLETLNG